MRTAKLALIAIVASLALAVPSLAAARTKTLIGTDGPGFTITMNKKTVKDPNRIYVGQVLRIR